MSIAFLYSEHGFNVAIFGLAIAYGLLAIAIRLARQGSDAFGGMIVFIGLKFSEGFFLTMALVALLGLLDPFIGTRATEHPAYAFIALAGGIFASIDLLIED